MAIWHWKYAAVEYIPKLSNEEAKPVAFNYRIVQLQQVEQLRTFRSSHVELYSKTEIKTNCIGVYSSAKQKPVGLYAKNEIHRKLFQRHWNSLLQNDICTIIIEQSTLMAASEIVEICLQKNL